MTIPTSWKLRSTSVVLLLPPEQTPDSQSISPARLVAHEIVPADWSARNSITLPMFAVVEYANGVIIRSEGSRLVFNQIGDGGLASEYPAYGVAERYARGTLMTRYQALGINWVFEAQSETPGVRFLRETQDLHRGRGYSPALVQFVRDQGKDSLNVSFRLNGLLLSVDFNYHIPVEDRPVVDLLHGWKAYEAIVQDELNNFFPER